MSRTGAKLLLLAVFAARGTSFIFSKTLLATQTPENIMAVRFLTAFLVLALVFYKKLLSCSRESLKGGILLGVLYMICMFCMVKWLCGFVVRRFGGSARPRARGASQL